MIEHGKFHPIPTTSEPDINLSLACVDNVWIRTMHFTKTGVRNVPHLHTHDHASLLSVGSVKVVVDKQETIFKAPCLILVHKDQLHYMEALEDNTILSCIHGLRDKETGELWPEESIPKGSLMEKMLASEARTVPDDFAAFVKNR